jgi:putative transposase
MNAHALANMTASFKSFCLASGIEALAVMMESDAEAACGPRHARDKTRKAHRWGKAKGRIGFHGGKVEIERPRLRSFDGKELALASWEAAQSEDWLGKWAMNQMLINVSTRKFQRSVRLPEGGVPARRGSGLSKSAASRHFVALSAARLKEWMARDLSGLELLVIQIDGVHMDEDMTLVAALGVDVKGDKHPLGLVEGATENAATVQALIDNLSSVGLIPPFRAFSSLTARRLSPRRSERPSAATRPFNAARFTRLATSWTACRSPCTGPYGACCGRHGR